MTASLQRVIFAGGGTGGHLFPGLAVLDALQAKGLASAPLFVGTARGLERKVIPERGLALALIDVRPLHGKPRMDTLKSLVRLPLALVKAVKVLRQHQTQLVIGLGGYAAGPLVLAAALLGIPTAILEQNAFLGTTNRLLLSIVGRAYLNYPLAAPLKMPPSAKVMGNPVRDAILKVKGASLEPRARVLVLGGSQGALAINQTVPEGLSLVAAQMPNLEIWHQTGAGKDAEVNALYQAHGCKADVVPFIDDMGEAYRWASLVISRAGATTLSELAVVGRPSILIPYPHAAAQHQHANARVFEGAGASVVLDQNDLNPNALFSLVVKLLSNTPNLTRMAEVAQTLGQPDAAIRIASDISHWLS